MKKIVILNILVGCMALAFTSCRDDDKVKYPDFEKGALPFFTADPELPQLIDSLDFDNTLIRFNVDTKDTTSSTGVKDLEFSPVERIDVTVTFINQSEGTSNTVVVSSLTSWPAVVELTDEDLIDLFPETVLTRDSLFVGDQFRFTADMILVDGRVLKGIVPGGLGYSPALQANLNSTFLLYTVGCGVAASYTGTYAITDPCGRFSGTATITNIGGTQRRFRGTFFGFPNVGFDISLLCGEVVIPISATGLSCGGPPITIESGNAPTSFDPNDDSSFQVRLFYADVPGCVPSADCIITLTKQ